MTDSSTTAARPSTAIERAGSVAVLRMQRGKANAFDLDFLSALRRSIAQIAASDARALVLVGEGRIFSAGVDLPRLVEGGRRYLEAFLPELSECFLDLFRFPRPAIAAVNGHAIAGGCVLACCCDRRLMTRGAARIGVPELRVGVPFPITVLEIVRSCLPTPIAQEMIIAGATYTAEEALARGVVHELVDEAGVLARAVAVAEEMAAVPAVAFAQSKAHWQRPALETIARHRAEQDAKTLEAWDSPEVREAVRAYVERTLKK